MEQLKTFFNAIANDPRIGVSHISLFCALLQDANVAECNHTVYIVSADIMKAAKISGLGTYHKCIKDLHKYGYLIYQPSYNHRKKSKVLIHVASAQA